MKKKIIIFSSIIIIIIILIFSIYLTNNITSFDVLYSTPKEAMIKQNNIKEDELITIIEDENYAVGIFKHNANIESRYLHKTENSWKMLYNKIFFYQYVKNVNGYIICQYKHNNKNIIFINKLSTNSENIIFPTDSIKSHFKYYIYEEDKTTKISYWFTVLDKLPENYEIKLDTDTIKLK